MSLISPKEEWLVRQQLFTYGGDNFVAEKHSLLSACCWIGTLKKPTQAEGGFLECATFLHFTTGLL
jgi:hypothetical protein